MTSSENEVVVPHVMPMWRLETNARTIVELQPSTLWLSYRLQIVFEVAVRRIALSRSISASNFFNRTNAARRWHLAIDLPQSLLLSSTNGTGDKSNLLCRSDDKVSETFFPGERSISDFQSF
jgi:hypothetical protein